MGGVSKFIWSTREVQILLVALRWVRGVGGGVCVCVRVCVRALSRDAYQSNKKVYIMSFSPKNENITICQTFFFVAMHY